MKEFEKLIAFLEEKKSPEGVTVIAIEGPCGCGKTTLAAQLQEKLGGAVIHMDDFFLPRELRTQERLAEPGGNVHYERFSREVLPHLGKTEGFSYTQFDCSKMALGERRQVPTASWQIVEGAYSCHPIFGNYMQIRLFLPISKEEQRKRIEARNGKEAFVTFETKWIPMEEDYFAQCEIRERADYEYLGMQPTKEENQ